MEFRYQAVRLTWEDTLTKKFYIIKKSLPMYNTTME